MNIKIYGADWCSDCVNVKKYFDTKGIKYQYIICTENDEVIEFIKSVNNGKRIIPTLEIDGEIYVNPGINKLMKIIGE
tara:strand:- start:3595 stop:3828 length:234 start_codon:yes stop_codon:yes gene_type:complete